MVIDATDRIFKINKTSIYINADATTNGSRPKVFVFIKSEASDHWVGQSIVFVKLSKVLPIKNAHARAIVGKPKLSFPILLYVSNVYVGKSIINAVGFFKQLLRIAT